ncbi:MAG TPA: NmrA family NAD(P)-binding protein [Mycobacterium sp.]|nr:NmrA family NAD(P)-binding protein [Mycobacterium sp.]
MSQLVLVTGSAGGEQGSTGRKVAELLLQQGVAVRAFVHTDDERAQHLRGLGADIVVGDLREIRDVAPAMAGVDGVFFTYPVIDGLLEATAVTAVAAKRAGVRRLVEVSQLWPDPDAVSPRTRQHWVSEQVFDSADIGVVHLRPSAFYESVVGFAAAAAAVDGNYAMPLGPSHTIVAMVAATDVARMAAVLLTDVNRPAEHHYQLIAAVRTIEEVIADTARVLGKPLRYVEVDENQWREQAIAAGMPTHTADHLSRLGRNFADAMKRHGQANSQITDIQPVTGEAPITLDEFLKSLMPPGASAGNGGPERWTSLARGGSQR